MIQETLTVTGKELILIRRVEPNKNDIRTAVREISAELTSDSIIYIAMDGCQFQQDVLDILQNNTDFKSHRINIFNLNVECDGFDENSVYIYIYNNNNNIL